MIRPSSGEPRDEELLERAREGDEEAYRVLFERHEELLRARIRRLLPRRLSRKFSEADVLQETRIAAFERRVAFRKERGSFRNWLLGIVDRKISEALRRHVGTAKRDANREVTRGMRVDTANHIGNEPTPSEAAVGSETADLARRARQALSDDDREVLRLVRDDELSLSDTAERMGRSRAAVKKLYGRALCRWKRAFEALRDGGLD